jgi:GT2 family glycosyltransferase
MIIAVLITCHNRKEKTLQCLNLLFKQNKINNLFKIEVFLVDDGCTDGTPAAVNENFSQVNLIKGSGSLYWNRGMNLAWVTAEQTQKYDYYLWLNDDTFLFENAIVDLLSYKNDNVIVCGSTKSEKDQNFSYGGYKNRISLIPNGEFQECDYSNGNVLLISRLVFEKNGNLDSIFHHALCDFDYNLRAKKLGIKILIGPNWSGYCENHVVSPLWLSLPSIFSRLKHLYSPASGCRPNEFFVFENRHYGFIKALYRYILIHIRVIFPSLWKLKNLKFLAFN